jgi:hypothetical protein
MIAQVAEWPCATGGKGSDRNDSDAFVAGVDPVEVGLVAQHEPARWQHHGRTQPSHSYSESLAAAGVQFVRAKCEVSPERSI